MGWRSAPDDPSEIGRFGALGKGNAQADVSSALQGARVLWVDLSRTHASGYNNETYVIGTEGTLHVGRFAGYPGPIHVELWTSTGELHPESRTFDMAHLTGDYPEFLPRFEEAYLLAHADFRDAVNEGRPFQVDALDALDAQVIVEAAHRSAMSGRASVMIERAADNLGDYRQSCEAAGLLTVSHAS